MKHDNNFDLLRLLAASQVVFTHCIKWLNMEGAINEHVYNLVFGFPGVAVFFVISGFLISRSWLNPRTTVGIFFDHRVRRIYPALWVNIAVILVMVCIAGDLDIENPTHLVVWIGTAFISGSDWIANLGSGGIVTPGFYPGFPSGVLWTLPIELCFYLLVPVIFQKWMNRSQMALLIAACFAASLIVHFGWSEEGHPYSIFKTLWIFLIGGFVGLFWDRLNYLFAGKALLWLAAYLATNFWSQSYGLYYETANITNVMQTLLLALTVIALAHSFKPLFGVLRGNDISYGIYLWHMPVIWTMRGFDLTARWRWVVVAYAIAATIAAVSWFLIERPVLKRKKKTAPRVSANVIDFPVMPSDIALSPSMSLSPSQ